MLTMPHRAISQPLSNTNLRTSTNTPLQTKTCRPSTKSWTRSRRQTKSRTSWRSPTQWLGATSTLRSWIQIKINQPFRVNYWSSSTTMLRSRIFNRKWQTSICWLSHSSNSRCTRKARAWRRTSHNCSNSIPLRPTPNRRGRTRIVCNSPSHTWSYKLTTTSIKVISSISTKASMTSWLWGPRRITRALKLCLIISIFHRTLLLIQVSRGSKLWWINR